MAESSVYIIETLKGRYYTGVTKDINKRFRQHSGEIQGGAKFFRSDSPSILVFYQKCETWSEALRLERAVKKLPRKWKELLIFGALSADELLEL